MQPKTEKNNKIIYMAENQTPTQGFVDVFVSKLKEQSFTIVIMLAVIWYQGVMMEERVAYWQKLYEAQKDYTEQTIKDDKQIMLDRIEYLQGQRDKYVEDAINELKSK
jgi:hypothetical protein